MCSLSPVFRFSGGTDPAVARVGVSSDEANLIMLQSIGTRLGDVNQWANITSEGVQGAMTVEGVAGLPSLWTAFRAFIRGPGFIKLGLEGAAEAANAAKLADMAGLLRTAKTMKGNYSLGEATASEAQALGEAWVGAGHHSASDGRTLVSADGLRVYRPPTLKKGSGKVQAIFEWKAVPGAQRSISNGHLDVK